MFDRFDDVGARSPGFLGYLLFPTLPLRGDRHAHDDEHQDLRRREPVEPSSRAATTSASCARGYGGGGHAVVGGVTLRGDELPRARATVDAMVRELNA